MFDWSGLQTTLSANDPNPDRNRFKSFESAILFEDLFLDLSCGIQFGCTLTSVSLEKRGAETAQTHSWRSRQKGYIHPGAVEVLYIFSCFLVCFFFGIIWRMILIPKWCFCCDDCCKISQNLVFELLSLSCWYVPLFRLHRRHLVHAMLWAVAGRRMRFIIDLISTHDVIEFLLPASQFLRVWPETLCCITGMTKKHLGIVLGC